MQARVLALTHDKFRYQLSTKAYIDKPTRVYSTLFQVQFNFNNTFKNYIKVVLKS